MKKLSLLSVVFFASLCGMEQTRSSVTGVFPGDIWSNIINIIITDSGFGLKLNIDKQYSSRQEEFLSGKYNPKIRDVILLHLSASSVTLNKLVLSLFNSKEVKKEYTKFLFHKASCFIDCLDCYLMGSGKRLDKASLETSLIKAFDSKTIVEKQLVGKKLFKIVHLLSDAKRKKMLQILVPKMEGITFSQEHLNRIPVKEIQEVLDKNNLFLAPEKFYLQIKMLDDGRSIIKELPGEFVIQKKIPQETSEQQATWSICTVQ